MTDIRVIHKPAGTSKVIVWAKIDPHELLTICDECENDADYEDVEKTRRLCSKCFSKFLFPEAT